MKKLLVPAIVAVTLCAAFIPVSRDSKTVHPTDQEALFEYPESVMAIIDAKCLGCHSPEGRNEKAKAALIWANVPGMDKKDAAAALDEILEVLEEGSMPPAKFLEKFPDKAMTKKETKELSKWADNLAEELIGE